MLLRAACLAWLLAQGPLQAAAADRPLVSVLGICSALTANTYPLDSVNWFDAGRHSQVIFYAHLLFPDGVEAQGPWHPPLVYPPQAPLPVEDAYFAEAEWLDPQGRPVAYYGLTFPARIRSDWLKVNGRDYIPHTFAMAIGTRDLNTAAGQTRLPALEGQYTVNLKVDRQPVGLAFFRMLRAAGAAPAPTGAATPLSAAVQAR